MSERSEEATRDRSERAMGQTAADERSEEAAS